MSLGSLVFAQPLALLGLLALPVIWWLLRATPPEPKRAELPSLKLLEEIDPREETPDRTPWWIIALRFTAAALAILGFARPVWQSTPSLEAGHGTVLIVVDDGWTSAPRWRDMIRTANAEVDQAADEDRSIQLVFTAPQVVAVDTPGVLRNAEARRRLQSREVSPWPPDRMGAIKGLNTGDIKTGRIVWITDGFDHGAARNFAEALKKIAPVEIRPFTPRSGFALSTAQFTPDGAALEVRRTRINNENITVSAENSSGAAIASIDVEFETDALSGRAEFRLPSVVLNQVVRFRILGVDGPGAVWLWDDAAQTPTIALADPVESPQPLLEEFYYVRKALVSDARLIEGSLADVLSQDPDAIILGDRADIEGELAEKLSEWMEAGGALIRFAGPRLAANDDGFTPAPLRPAARALGGALAWDEPQPIAPFPANSPFAGLSPPNEAYVRRQVLAQPQPGLDELTWARLTDGTPLVSAVARGRGAIILFHVTANTAWSDLPFSGVFPQMLKRAALTGTLGSARRTDAEGALAPIRVLNGRGILMPPPATLKPVSIQEFATAKASRDTPPGLYAGPQGTRAINAGVSPPPTIDQWPPGVSVIQEEAESRRRGIDGWLLSAALGLLLIDALVALEIAGRLPQWGSKTATLAIVTGTLAILTPVSDAQELSQKAREAALSLRFAYVETGDTRRDETARAGLQGLSYQLYRRTSVEPDLPHGVKLGEDALEFYPMLYFSPPRDAEPLSATEVGALNAYLRSGGALVIDTANATPGADTNTELRALLQGLDAPPLQPAPEDHVIRRSFYLIENFPGRLGQAQFWLESSVSGGETRRGDGVSGLFIGSVDWAGAWAVDDDYRPLYPVEGDPGAREQSIRFGVNLVMYVLTGNYKEDQVHLPALLDRLDEEAGLPRFGTETTDGQGRNRVRTIIENNNSTKVPVE